MKTTMKTHHALCGLISGLALAIASIPTTAHAEIILPTGITSSTVPSSGTTLDNIIDGSLLAPLTESNKLTVASNDAYEFEVANQYLVNNVNNGTFTFTDSTIAQILIWNYSQSALRGLDAISNVEVDTGTGFASVLTNFALVPAGDANGFRAQVINLGEITGVDAIRLTVAQGDTGFGETAGGFDEVAFSDVAAVPEPTSELLLLGSGAMLLLRRRRASAL